MSPPVRALFPACVVICLAALGSASATAGEEATIFEEVTSRSGIDTPHQFVYLITGQAWGDVDGDGCPDLYLTRSDGPNDLYRNLCDGGFERVEASGAELPEHVSGGAAFADYDNDGWLDLYVAGFAGLLRGRVRVGRHQRLVVALGGHWLQGRGDCPRRT